MSGWPDPENARLYSQARDDLMAMYERLVGQGDPAPRDVDPAMTMLTGSTPGDGTAAILIDDPTPGYCYSDPVDDPDWPRIQASSDDDWPDEFPVSWSSEPTQRDQAAIDAGNA